MEFEDQIEITKLSKDNVHVYKLPPMSSSVGHVVDDFKDLIFRGDMKITVKGNLCVVYFLNEDKSIFLISIINENIEQFVQEASGSTRYFTLKAMTVEGVPGIYGVVFKQRNDAFDFMGTIRQYKEKLLFEQSLKDKKEDNLSILSNTNSNSEYVIKPLIKSEEKSETKNDNMKK